VAGEHLPNSTERAVTLTGEAQQFYRPHPYIFLHKNPSFMRHSFSCFPAFLATPMCVRVGSPEALTVCVRQMCNIMLENPARGPHIPYKPMALPAQGFQPRANVSPLMTTFSTQCVHRM